MTKRNPISSIQNIWFDAEQVDDSDLTLEQNYNATIQSGIINNHIGSGVLPEVLTQNVLFDSSLVTDFLDGKAISESDVDFHISQPADNNFGNQLEIELSDSLAAGKRTVKFAIIGLDFESNLQYETFVFRTNEIQVSHKHFTKILVLLFNDFIGDPSLSLNLGGRLVVREAKPLTLSRSPIMIAQDVQPNLFFRDFYMNGTDTLLTALSAALPYYNIDTLNIYAANADQKVLLNGDITTQIGQKFIATTNNIQKITLLLSARNLELGSEDDLAWAGDLVLSIYPLQSNIECPSDVVPELAIDFSPINIPVAQISVNYDSLKAQGIVLDDGYGNSVPQPVDFVFSNSPVASGNILTVGNYYAFALKRAGSANKCDILIDVGSDLISNSRITTFTGTLWVDLPEQDLWFKIYTDAAKVSDGQAYESGVGVTVEKTTIDPESLATIDYSLKDIQFTGNDVYRAVLSANTDENTPIPDQRTGQPVNSRKEAVPEIRLLNSIDIVNLESASEPLLLGAISDKNKKSFDPASATFLSKLHGATMVNDEIVIRVVDDPTDVGRYDTSVTDLESNLLNGYFIDAKIYPNYEKPNIYYRVADAKLCSMVVGDVNGDGIIDNDDLDLLETYIGFNFNSGLPQDSTITTTGGLGSTTTYTNGYTAYLSAFTNITGVSFQVIHKTTGLVVAEGIDGVLQPDPADERLAKFDATSVNFSSIVGLDDYKLAILSPTTLNNYGVFTIVGVDNLDTLTIRKVILTGDSISEMMRADIDGDFAVTQGDGYLLLNYINRVPYVLSPYPTYPAPTTDPYTKIGTKFNVIRLKVEKFIDRADDYSPVSVGRSTEIHPPQDVFLSDGYFANHDFYNLPVVFTVQQQLTWDEHLIINNSKAKMVPCVFTSLTGGGRNACTLDGILCNTFPIAPDHESGVVDLFAPDNIIIGDGDLKRPDGSFYKVDFEVGTIVLEIPNGLYSSEKTINILEGFIATQLDGTTNLPTGITRLGFPAMRFADCSFVDLYALTNDQVRFSVAVQSFSPNTNGTDDDGYTGAIVDGKIGVSVDYENGLLTLNFTNLYEDIVLSTLSTKIQISVYLKKGGFNNLPLFVDSAKVQNILLLNSIFSGPGVGGPATLIDLDTEVTGVLPIVHGGTGLNATGAYGTVLMSSGGSLSYQFVSSLAGVIAYSTPTYDMNYNITGSVDADKVPKTDGYGLLDPSFYYKNPVYVYGTAGTFSNDSESPAVVGAFPFRLDNYIGQGIRDIKLEVILETTNASNAAKIDLYNVSTHSYVPLTVDGYITTTATSATYVVSDNIASVLSSGASDFVYEIHLSLSPGSVTETAICKMARLVITYAHPYAGAPPVANSYNFVPFYVPLP